MPLITAMGQVLASRASFDQLNIHLLGCSKSASIMQTLSLSSTTPGILVRTASLKAFH